jgi:hypothetical protein
LREAVPLETWNKVCETAVAQAVAGDAKAREWLGNYLVGRPIEAVAVEEPQGPRLPLCLLLAAIREAVPDPEAQARIAAVLARMGRQAAGDDPSDERPGPPRVSPPRRQVMSIIMSVVMSILDEYPGARAKMVTAMEQFRLMLHDRGGSAPSNPGRR